MQHCLLSLPLSWPTPMMEVRSFTFKGECRVESRCRGNSPSLSHRRLPRTAIADHCLVRNPLGREVDGVDGISSHRSSTTFQIFSSFEWGEY